MPSADDLTTPTAARPSPRPTRFDAALSALTTALLVLSVGAVGWGVLGPDLGSDSTTVARVDPSEPVRLRIPSLRVSAEVVPVALTPDAVLNPPEDGSKVGWWDGSALPGATSGRVVITGHTLADGTGALDEVVDLRRGEVLLTTSTGTRRYRVTDRVVADYTTVAERARDIFGQTEESPDGARLILVTCTDFNGSVYESNVIIVAEPVTPRA